MRKAGTCSILVVLLIQALAGQTPAPFAVPFVSQVSPASIAPGQTDVSLTIVGANFMPYVTVTMGGPGSGTMQATNITVNSAGTQIVAHFGPLPTALQAGVARVTVASPFGTVSNTVYLPITSATAGVGIRSNLHFGSSVNPYGSVAADFNNDRYIDVSSIDQALNQVSTFRGYGNGWLSATSTYTVGVKPSAIASGDLNGDGRVDLVVANAGSNTVSILLGNGDGTFVVNSTSPQTGLYPDSIVVADFNRDGKLDIAVANACGSDPSRCTPAVAPRGPFVLSILLGNGDGTFTPSPFSPTTGGIPSSIVAGDFNNDGYIDLAVTDLLDNTITVLMGNGDGTFAPTNVSPSTDPQSVAMVPGDFNRDGFLDLAVVSEASGSVRIFLNQACSQTQATQCTFDASPAIRVGNGPVAIAAADMNGGGILDLVTANAPDSNVSVLLGDGAGGFVLMPQTSGFTTPPNPNGIVLADLDGDGRLDIVATGTYGWYSTMMQSPVATVVLNSWNPPMAGYGQQLSFMASISGSLQLPPPSGTVTLMDGSTSLGTVPIAGNQAFLQTSNLSVGTHQLTAIYNGDSNYAASASSSVTETILQTQSTTTLTASPNPSGTGQRVTFTATVQPYFGGTATGTVTFLDLGGFLASVPVVNNTAQLAISSYGVGSHPVVAIYNGDLNVAGSSSVEYVQNVTQATTTLAISADPSGPAYGQAITLSATVQPSYPGGNVTGTVAFYNGSFPLQTVPVQNGVAQVSWPNLTPGTYVLSAVYSGDPNFAGSSSAPFSLTVSQAAIATTLSSNSSSVIFGQPVTFTVALAPAYGGVATGTITFTDGATSLGTAAVSGNAAQFTLPNLPGGVHSMTATYSGDANFKASQSPIYQQTVSRVTAPISITSSVNSSTYGQSVSFSATVQPPAGTSATGTVALMEGQATLGTAILSGNTAQFTISGLASGTHSITAAYLGDGNFTESTSTAVSQVVSVASSTTSLSSNANPAMRGQGLTLTAVVQLPVDGTTGGTVTFFDGTDGLGTVVLTGNTAQFTTSTLTAGTHSISARYSGDTNFAASVSSPVVQVITQSATTVAVTSSVNPSTFGQVLTFRVAVQSTSTGTPTGTVTLMDGPTALATSALPSNGTLQFAVATLGSGSHSVSATYSGDSNFAGGTSTAISQLVNQAATTTVLNSNMNPSSFGQQISLTASVQAGIGGTPSGTVVFFDGGTQIGTASLVNGAASIAVTLSAGTHSINANYGGDSNFVGSSGAINQIINPAGTILTLTSSLNPARVGQSITFTASASSAVNENQSGTVNFYLDGSTTPVSVNALSAGVAAFTTASLTPGNHTLSATFVSSNSNFQGSVAATLAQSVTDFSISASPTSRTISRNHSGTYTLTVNPLTGFTGNVSLSCSGVPANVTCSVAPTFITLNGTNSAQATVTVGVSRNATVGTRTLILKGQSGTGAHSVSVGLTVN